MEIYIVETWVGNYNIVGTGFNAKDALQAAWSVYRRNGFDDFRSKKKWFEYHGLDEDSCRKVIVGDGWCD